MSTKLFNTAIETILVKETLLFYYSWWRCIAFLTNKNSSPEYCNYSTVLQITNSFLPKLKRKHKYMLYKLDSNLFWVQIVLKCMCILSIVSMLRETLPVAPTATKSVTISVRERFSRLCQVVAYGRSKTIENLKNHL